MKKLLFFTLCTLAPLYAQECYKAPQVTCQEEYDNIVTQLTIVYHQLEYIKSCLAEDEKVIRDLSYSTLPNREVVTKDLQRRILIYKSEIVPLETRIRYLEAAGIACAPRTSSLEKKSFKLT